MKKFLKIITYVCVCVLAIFVLLLLALEPVVNTARIKSEIESIFSEKFDMNFKIMGVIDIDFFPEFSIVPHDVRVSIPTGQIASAEKIIIDPSLLDLLFLNVRLLNVVLHDPALRFDPLAIAKIMALVKAEAPEYKPIDSFSIESFSISNAKFHYADDDTLVDLSNINVSGGSLLFIADHKTAVDDVVSFLKGIHFRGDFNATEISSPDFKLENIRATINDQYGVLTADPVELNYLDSLAKLSGRLDLNQAKPHLKLRVSSSELNLSSYAKKFYPQITAKGKLSIDAGFSATDIELNQLLQISKKTPQPGRTVGSDIVSVKSITVDTLKISGKNLSFSGTGTALDITSLALTTKPLIVIQNNRLVLTDADRLLKTSIFKGHTIISRLSAKDLVFENIQANLSGERGLIKSDSIELDYFGARTKIAGFFNMQDNLNYLKARIEIPEFDLEKPYQESWEADLAKGKINIKAEFETRAAFTRDMLKKVNGYFSIKGQNLILKGVDLDKALDEFKKISRYGFNDFSALLLLGPLGTVVSHGYDQLEALEKMMAATGDSAIKQVVSDWNVVAGVATAEDVAFSTQRNRVAVKGGLDLPNKKFNNVTIAVVDPEGCIVNGETVDGPFENPEVKDVGVVERLIVRPLKKFFQTKCIFFYDGAVPHPPGQR